MFCSAIECKPIDPWTTSASGSFALGWGRYDESVDQSNLQWQSKAVLLLVLPAVAVDAVFEARWWSAQATSVAIWTLGLSALLGLFAWTARSATSGAAFTGAAITASLMFSTTMTFPYEPWRTGLTPVLAVLILTSISTVLGRRHKEHLGTAESRRGRKAAQVAANLGAAALVSSGIAQSWQINQSWLRLPTLAPSAVFTAGLAALCEAAADTVSSELGQLFDTRPRMITTLRVAKAGTDGAISLGGTMAGVGAASVVALVGSAALRGDPVVFYVSWVGGVFGLLFDSVLGATLERRGWLNNDAVNFLSTLSAAAFALAALPFLAQTKMLH
jgi:uncharacterized protein (TIGR00297 family)